MNAWEKRKLAEVAEINPKSEIPETFRYIDLESVKGSAIINSRSETRQTAPSRAQRTARIGDVFYQTVRPYQRNNVIFLLRTTEPYVFSSGYAQLRSLVNPFFILYLVQTDNFVNRVLNRATGTSYPAINPTHLSNIPVWIPQSFSEQKRVGQLLRRLDNLITATQHKIDALEQVKKALLQRLFDQSWRFDGYLETWKKYRLGDHAEILTGGTPKTSVAEYWEPKSIPWMSSGEVNKVYLDQTDTMISLEGFKNSSARWVKKHSILIALAGQGKTRGTVAVNNIALTTNQSIAAIIPGKDLYYEFVFQNLTNRYNELRLISSGDGTRGGLNKQIVSDVTIHSPNLNEQIRIGKLLSKVDHLSTENQLKLSRIELIKKYLLQTLFI